MTITNKLPIWFWVIAVLTLVWNIMGVMAYLGQAYMPAEALAVLPQNEQDFYNNMPAWVTAAFAIAVFSGTLGCIALIFRKKWAYSLFIISIIGVIGQTTYNLFIQDYVELSGVRIIMPIMIIVIGIFLIWFSNYSQKKGWIS
ncbi:hypothetical protein M0D21_01610 [Aquimarina sp. D1M17]|uniref:hypothetical protein n=1 Tax=Aquimarina acroporae TaxID=2937283 RepID=UPI0020C10956|nr:hypothetical protein [Aquimarina acroporae]MCK8520241.1 hypothetical protein [Aquimarina acroporae]